MNPKDTGSKSGQTHARPTVKSGAADLATAVIDPYAVVLIQQQDIRQRVDQLATDAMLAGEGGDSTAKLLRTLSEIATETKAAGLTSVAGLIAEMRQALEQKPAQPEAFLANITRLQAATGWRPQMSLDEGLERTVAWCRTLSDRSRRTAAA
mgnify:CR=1 FL=1